ncbi:hypothetical protein LCGC14_1660910, partial [marine sediment metagenome]
MAIERITFPGPDGTELSARLDMPEGPHLATALFAHCFTCGKDMPAARRIAGRLAAMGIAVLIAGTLQLAAGIFRLGQWFRAVSPAVVHGMLAGIGVLIVSSQLHVMVDDRPRGSGIENIVSIPESMLKGLPLPTWEAAPERASRIELLQLFGDLHERQGEIQREVA